MNGLSQQNDLIKSLQRIACFPHQVATLLLIQTHISWILLTGPFAYKIKKAVNLGFLDFSTLEKRKYLCEEELRLNRRFSPDLYLEVVPITGNLDSPRVGGGGEVLEYAVKMREFPQTALLSSLAERNGILPVHVDQIAESLAEFHRNAARTDDQQANTGEGTPPYGTFDAIAAPVRENFNQLRQYSSAFKESEKLQWLERWSEEQLELLKPAFIRRLTDGFIRECHGDLHLGNIAVVDGEIRFFDCIEFNPAFRWIDTISELAFLLMDLEDYGYHRYAGRLLNRYLEQTFDYEGLGLLTFYKVYRAMVRVKVNAIRLAQIGASQIDPEQNKDLDTDRQKTQEACNRYLCLAEKSINARAPFFSIMHGVSGTGKSTVSAKLADEYGALRLRSDLERKRLHGMAGTDKTHSELNAGIYSGSATEKTYDRLAEISEYAISGGYPVIADATFLSRMKRHDFMAIAVRHQVPFIVFHCQASETTLVNRLKKRETMEGEASEAGVPVMRNQLENQNRLSVAEKHWTININTESEFNPETVLDALNDRGVKLISGKK